MSKHVNKNISTNGLTWDQMIEDAKERIRKLEISIRVFTQKKEAGEPFPLKATQN